MRTLGNESQYARLQQRQDCAGRAEQAEIKYVSEVKWLNRKCIDPCTFLSIAPPHKVQGRLEAREGSSKSQVGHNQACQADGNFALEPECLSLVNGQSLCLKSLW